MVYRVRKLSLRSQDYLQVLVASHSGAVDEEIASLLRAVRDDMTDRRNRSYVVFVTSVVPDVAREMRRSFWIENQNRFSFYALGEFFYLSV